MRKQQRLQLLCRRTKTILPPSLPVSEISQTPEIPSKTRLFPLHPDHPHNGRKNLCHPSGSDPLFSRHFPYLSSSTLPFCLPAIVSLLQPILHPPAYRINYNHRKHTFFQKGARMPVAFLNLSYSIPATSFMRFVIQVMIFQRMDHLKKSTMDASHKNCTDAGNSSSASQY